ncbi:ABC transporter permease [Acrocarpospora catenulata]|uniref:ABC transporter permease n=1 Tax=Acrocarpospora catenulata TaxID=2836182 RepID=UPI001BD97F07|nr:ABC transporter permease [Acrocarpospora catenulata]
MTSVETKRTGGKPRTEVRAGPGLLRRNATRVILAVLILAVIACVVVTPAFLTPANIRAVVQNAALMGIVAVTMTPMAMSGNFISLGTQQSMVLASMSFLALLSQGVPAFVAVVVILAGLTLLGVLQGVIVALGLNSVITTLAFGVIVVGVIQKVNSGGADVTAGDHPVGWGAATVLGIPLQVVVLIVVTVLVTGGMTGTTMGRRAMLTGANAAAAKVSGIPTNRVTVGVFALASAGMGLAGILGAAQFGISGPGDFSEITFGAASAILIGGTSIAGGMGSALRSAIGAVVIGGISRLMTLNSFTPGTRGVIEGALVIGVVVAVETARLRRTRG